VTKIQLEKLQRKLRREVESIIQRALDTASKAGESLGANIKALRKRTGEGMESAVDGMREIEPGMSNLGHFIPEGLEERLRKGKVWAHYAGWNFFARVWFDGAEKFACEVMVYNKFMEIICEDSLQEIMETVCDKYGGA